MSFVNMYIPKIKFLLIPLLIRYCLHLDMYRIGIIVFFLYLGIDNLTVV